MQRNGDRKPWRKWLVGRNKTERWQLTIADWLPLWNPCIHSFACSAQSSAFLLFWNKFSGSKAQARIQAVVNAGRTSNNWDLKLNSFCKELLSREYYRINMRSKDCRNWLSSLDLFLVIGGWHKVVTSVFNSFTQITEVLDGNEAWNEVSQGCVWAHWL